MRLFVAVWPPPEVVDALEALVRPPVEGVRWTAPDRWHVTLRFLGEVPDGDVDRAAHAVTAAAAAVAPVDAVVADRLSRFGRQVAHVAVDGLAPWAAAVGQACAAHGFATPDERPFVGHLTLARARGRGRGGGIAALDGLALPPGPRRWRASELTLVRSHLGGGGGRYETLVRAPAG